ncbi:enolase C-terminal domain-like protein, partial [Candidatus Latescibacterota bacterium]
GPVLNNAMSGLDMALWDIKGKRANMPVYQLLGGKCRFAINCYTSTSGNDLAELEDGVNRLIEQGYRVIRIDLGAYASPQYTPPFKNAGFGKPDDIHQSQYPYVKMLPKTFEYLRAKFGDEIEFLHDMVIRRLQPIDAINLIKQVEQYRPFFIEDPFTAEDKGYYKLLREQTSCPIAFGEEFSNPNSWEDIISGRLIDFIRCHLSYIGGLTPAIKLARFCEWFNVRTAWHGPADCSPVGHAAHAHLDLAVWNFGIQEFRQRSELEHEIYPGCPTFKKDKDGNGYLYVNEAPGLGIDINEKLAARYPLAEEHSRWWNRKRQADGTLIRQ